MAKISRDAFAPHPLDRKQPKAGPVDWTQPLELDNGLPVIFDPDFVRYGNVPDKEGDYCLVREDGKIFPDNDLRFAFFGPDGQHFAGKNMRVRNRGSA